MVTPNRLRRYRKEKKLLQTDIAKYLGIKNTAEISRWESGLMLPSTINLLKLSIIYQTPIELLYEDLMDRLSSGSIEPSMLVWANDFKQRTNTAV